MVLQGRARHALLKKLIYFGCGKLVLCHKPICSNVKVLWVYVPYALYKRGILGLIFGKKHLKSSYYKICS